MATPEDLFTQCYRKIWEHLEAHEPLNAMVSIGNRIKYADDRMPRTKPGHSAADLPELSLLPSTGVVDFDNSLGQTAINQDYILTVLCGKKQANRQLYPIKWEIIKALRKAADNFGITEVYRLNITDNVEILQDDDSDDIYWRWELTLTLLMTTKNSTLTA